MWVVLSPSQVKGNATINMSTACEDFVTHEKILTGQKLYKLSIIIVLLHCYPDQWKINNSFLTFLSALLHLIVKKKGK